MSGNTGLLLLVEAELGAPMYEIPTGDYNAQEQAKKQNCISTLGVGRTAPQGWMDADGVHENLQGVRMVSPMPLPEACIVTSTTIPRLTLVAC